MSKICKRSTKDVLEVMLKDFNLSEVYLTVDGLSSEGPFTIARNATNILTQHIPIHFKSFKKNVLNASFFDSWSEHSNYNNSYIKMHIHTSKNFLMGGYNTYIPRIDIKETAEKDDIKFPEFASLGVRCPDVIWNHQSFEYVVPYTINEKGIIMLVIFTNRTEWMIEALEILYPDLSVGEKDSIFNEIKNLQQKQWEKYEEQQKKI